MKQLMLGNKALARGLYEAGCSVVSSYPGTPSTEVTEEAAKYDEIYCEWAPNEKVAMEVAFGASLAGKRSFCGMKHVGLNVAADPLFTCSYTGVNGGMVICVADDPGMHSSQNEQDSRHHAIASKIPMLEPSDSREAYEFAKKAFELSEEFDTPVIIKMCTRVAHSQSIVEPGERVVPETIPYEKNIAKYVMMPGNAIRRHPVVEERTRKLIEYGNHCDFNRVEMADTKLGIITSSTCYQYAKEVFGEQLPDTFDEETLTTINKFFENNLNVSETSRQLYVHRNTLVYRLEKLQKSTGLDIRVFDDALTFKIAMMVVSYMKYMETQD